MTLFLGNLMVANIAWYLLIRSAILEHNALCATFVSRVYGSLSLYHHSYHTRNVYMTFIGVVLNAPVKPMPSYASTYLKLLLELRDTYYYFKSVSGAA